MAKSASNLTYIFLFDPTRLISDEVRGRFNNTLKYRLANFTNLDEVTQTLKKLPIGRMYTRVCIYVMNGGIRGENRKDDFAEFYSGIKKIDKEMNVICLVNRSEEETEKKSGIPSSCIAVPNNDNAILRITNHILGIVSKENLERKYLSAKRSVQMLLLFVLFILALAIGAYFLFPQYFG